METKMVGGNDVEFGVSGEEMIRVSGRMKLSGEYCGGSNVWICKIVCMSLTCMMRVWVLSLHVVLESNENSVKDDDATDSCATVGMLG